MTFKTLVIDPSRPLRSGGSVGSGEQHRALHITRGHFVTYTEDRKLFGKYTGTFWKKPHARGALVNGEVVKTYRVKPPKAGIA